MAFGLALFGRFVCLSKCSRWMRCRSADGRSNTIFAMYCDAIIMTALSGFEFINIWLKKYRRKSTAKCVIHLNNKLSARPRFHFRMNCNEYRMQTPKYRYTAWKCKQEISAQIKHYIYIHAWAINYQLSAISTIFDGTKSKYLQRNGMYAICRFRSLSYIYCRISTWHAFYFGSMLFYIALFAHRSCSFHFIWYYQS